MGRWVLRTDSGFVFKMLFTHIFVYILKWKFKILWPLKTIFLNGQHSPADIN